MIKVEVIFSLKRFRLTSQWLNPFQKLNSVSSVRHFSDQSKAVTKVKAEKDDREIENVKESKKDVMENKKDDSVFQTKFTLSPYVKYWSESAAIRKVRKRKKIVETFTHTTHWAKYLQSLNDFPTSISELAYWHENKLERRQLLEQQFLPQRHAILRPDLAAAHFLVARGGSVKFVGYPDWIGAKEKKTTLPLTYVPGLFVEGLKAEGTNLYYEGLNNLCKLRHITHLSLKGLEQMSDWCLDWISKEYYLTLTHLDLTDCKNITYRGLSCFYRFESLKTLNVTGISESAEFKLACIMLQDVLPELEIVGINLEIPKKVEPVNEETKLISDSELEQKRFSEQ